MSQNDRLKQWISSDDRFIKVKAGETYECLFKSMAFDATGGFHGKATVKYNLEDLKDHKIREMSSGSKKFASKMTKLKEGDLIRITATLGQNDTKSLDVIVLTEEKEEKTVDETVPGNVKEDDELMVEGGEERIPF